MDDIIQKVNYALFTIVGGFLAIGYKLFMYWKHRVDDEFTMMRHEIERVESGSVTRDTIIRIEADWRDEITLLRAERKESTDETRRQIDQRHAENREDMRLLREELVGIRGRLDKALSIRGVR